MNKILKTVFVVVLSNLLCSCNLDFKEAKQVSLNMQEAKEKKVFVAEYSISNIQTLDSNYIFPIQSVWEERAWQLALNKDKTETYKILDSSSNNLIFQLNEKDTLITKDNFSHGKWIMYTMDNPENFIGSTRGMINLGLKNKELKDTTSIAIFRLNDPHNYNNNLKPLFKFDIIRQ